MDAASAGSGDCPTRLNRSMTTPASKPAPKKSDLPARLISAAVLIPLLILVGWLGGITVAVVATLASLIGLNEMLLLVRRAGWRPLRREGIVLGALVTAAAAFDGQTTLLATAAVAGALLIASGIIRRNALFLGDFVFTTVPVLYVALPLASIILLRDGPAGLQWVILAFAATFALDTGAYAVGRLIGQHKMAPSISPGKTWEGAAGGFLAAIGATIGLVVLLDDITTAYWQAAVLGAGIGVVGQLGDLAESKLKRVAKVKDSGILIPGHGGLLDRLDSLVLVFPLVYYASKLWPTA
jgi:phosphatidate cytidylyltransferase